MNKKFISIILLIVFMSISGCNKTEEKKQFDISINDKDTIKYVTIEESYENKGLYKLFDFAFDEESFGQIPYVENGEKIYIDFGSNAVDEFIIKDHLLNSKGELMYTSKEIIDVPVVGEDEKYYFVINTHMASLLSSYYEEGKKDYRGFTIIATKDGMQEMYVFVLQTDAT